MAQVSIIIPAYNVSAYIGACLDSASSQTLEDVEIVVVDDASTDGTKEIVARAAQRDGRIRLVCLPVNGGLHLARKAGVEAATGTYALFLDGDDELDPATCATLVAHMEEHPADILHYGIRVLPEHPCDAAEAARIMEGDHDVRPLFGDEIIRAIYDEREHHRLDWRVTQRLFRMPLVKEAFARMSSRRLERAEDGYEMFVIAALAQSHRSLDGFKGYRYHYGRGVTGSSRIAPEVFRRFCLQFKACLDAARAFVESRPSQVLETCYEGFAWQDGTILTADWLERLDAADKPQGMAHFGEVFGAHNAAAQLYRLVRDRAYDALAHNAVLADDDEVRDWCALAQAFEESAGAGGLSWRCARMKAEALGHRAQLDARTARTSVDGQPICIFVTTHKPVDRPKSSILRHVQVGPGLATNRFDDMLHDDDGENISDRNAQYCELTTQYWAWKNVPDARYYGFCHYRRYFNFTATRYEENGYGEVIDDFIDGQAAARYGFDDETIARCIEGFDVITTPFQDLTEMPGDFATPYEQYAAAPYLHIADLDAMAQITKRRYPDYAVDVDAFLQGHTACFCNMFVMKRDIFFDYCAWLFPILDEFSASCDMSRYSREALRTPGHLAERLFNIYYAHHMRVGSGWKTKQLQCVHFEHPDLRPALRPLAELPGVAPASPDRPFEPIPVVFAADGAYVPMLTTTVYSMLANADPARFYDIVILAGRMPYELRAAMQEFLSQFPYANVRFYEAERYVAGCDLVTNNDHISIETYYRFLIQDVLPFYDKVLYLDSDLIIEGDVSELYDTDLGDNLVAAVRDVDFLGNLNMNDGERLTYARDVLQMRDPYDYFQAGVLVLNTREMRAFHSAQEWLNIASSSTFIYDDQDILSSSCEGRVAYLPHAWNVMHDCGGRVAKVFSFAPAEVYADYLAARAHPAIIHYAGYEKPWKFPACDYARDYWKYARETPFYEQLLMMAAAESASAAPAHFVPLHEKAVAEDSKLRRYVDPLAPLGSARREVLKSIARFVQGKK